MSTLLFLKHTPMSLSTLEMNPSEKVAEGNGRTWIDMREASETSISDLDTKIMAAFLANFLKKKHEKSGTGNFTEIE